MKTTQLIKLLNSALAEYGDIPIKLMNYQTGEWHSVQSLIRLHPYTSETGVMNRRDTVKALAITRSQNEVEDWSLGMANKCSNSEKKGQFEKNSAL